MIARSQRKMFKNHNIGNVSFLINSGWKFGGFSGFFFGISKFAYMWSYLLKKIKYIKK